MRHVNEFTMGDPETVTCPFSYYAAMRSEDPVHRDPATGFYWVTRREDVLRLAQDWELMSSQSGLVIRKVFQPRAQALWEAAGMSAVDTFVTSDPPAHDDYRAVGMKFFDPAKVERISSEIEALANQIIDEMPEGEVVDFVYSFAAQMQGRLLCKEFGVPLADLPQFKQWTDAVFEMMIPGLPEDREVELIKLMIAMFEYLDERLSRAGEEAPGTVLHTLANAKKRDGSPFTSIERRWMAFTAFSGGNDTTRNMMLSGIHKLATEPELQAELRDDPAKVSKFVEEILRLEGAVQGSPRVATRDVEIEGTLIPKGASVILCYGSANRDDVRWSEAESFRLDRADGNRHVAFGYGRHTCIGMHLARRELQIAFRVLLCRLDNIQLVIPEEGIRRIPHPYFRGIENLPITYVKR